MPMDYYGNAIQKRTPKKRKAAGIYNPPNDGLKLGTGIQKDSLEEKTPSSLSASGKVQSGKRKNKNRTLLGIYG